VFYFSVATAFAVISIVCSLDWAVDSYIKDDLNGFVKNFRSHKVSIFGLMFVSPVCHMIPGSDT